MVNPAEYADFLQVTSTEPTGSGWSVTYSCSLSNSAHTTTAHPPNGFLIRLELFNCLHPLYFPGQPSFLLDSSLQLLPFPPSHFSSYSSVHRFVLSVLSRLGVPDSDPDSLARHLFSFFLAHRHAAATALVPLRISFTATTVLRNHFEALDWVHGGTPESHVVRTLRSTFESLRWLKRESFYIVDEECCMVCLEGFDHEQRVTRLPACSHLFHFRCVAQWLRFDHRCPLCRAPTPWIQATFHDHRGLENPRSSSSQSPRPVLTWILNKLDLFLNNAIKKMFAYL